MRLTLAALALALLGAALGGCVYRMDVQQGNYLEGKTVDQLQVGMTRTQVRYLLGTPLVQDPRRLVVYFKDDKVTHFERINVPQSAPQAPEEGAPIQKFPKI